MLGKVWIYITRNTWRNNGMSAKDMVDANARTCFNLPTMGQDYWLDFKKMEKWMVSCFWIFCVHWCPILGQINLSGSWSVMEYIGSVVADFHARSWFHCLCVAANLQRGPFALMHHRLMGIWWVWAGQHLSCSRLVGPVAHGNYRIHSEIAMLITNSSYVKSRFISTEHL